MKLGKVENGKRSVAIGRFKGTMCAIPGGREVTLDGRAYTIPIEGLKDADYLAFAQTYANIDKENDHAA